MVLCHLSDSDADDKDCNMYMWLLGIIVKVIRLSPARGGLKTGYLHVKTNLFVICSDIGFAL